jgi:periplasmic divalent cation tolerance protein
MIILVGYVTFGSEPEAKKHVKALLDRKLIACGNIFPITSMYIWEGQSNDETEWVALLKTMPSKWSQIEEYLENQHSYDVPCIACWEIQVNRSYGNWVEKSCSSPG